MPADELLNGHALPSDGINGLAMTADAISLQPVLAMSRMIRLSMNL